MNNLLRYKGKIMTEKQYKRRMKQIENGMMQKKQKVPSEPQCIVEGCRIVELMFLGQQLHCSFCTEILSLESVEKEVRKGLASILTVRCTKCLAMTSVSTSKMHQGPAGSSRQNLYNINSKTALGTIHSGLGHSAINKFLHVLNIPSMTSKTFKKYEREVGPIVENIAKDSCAEACEKERQLTFEQLENLQNSLPNSVTPYFLTPERSSSLINDEVHVSLPSNTENEISLSNSPNNAQYITCTANEIIVPDLSVKQKMQESIVNIDTDKNNVHNEKIRVFASYDMGWHTRGSGFQYDSLSGVGHLIGSQSGKVMEYATRNRKCRMCDKGHLKTDHECRLNYHGTAKAMEADVAVQLVAQSSILKEKNIEVGVFIADNDSTSICAIKKAVNYYMVKQSDKNHTAKGVKTLLYKIDKSKDPDKELTSEVIKYLHKCFTYAISQNKGNSLELSAAIRNIPFHAFNDHQNCGDWCTFVKNKENYVHRSINGSLKNEILFSELKSIFQKLADNAESFLIGASTQANESLNNIISKKCPKSIPYECSESYDYRVACAVAQKNKGEQYVQDTLKKLELSPGSHLSKHIMQVTKSATMRAEKSKTRKFKLRRLSLQKNRAQLKNQRETIEGCTYESNIGLFQTPATISITDQEIDSQYDHPSTAILFFDIETGGFSMSDDIIQIAVKYNNTVFNKYINPTRRINSKASTIHGLTNESSDLYLRGVKVQSFPIRIVLADLLTFLKNIGKTCLLVAHNCQFDASRLLLKIKEACLMEDFTKIILGFCDSLSLFKKQFPNRKGKGVFKLTTLAKELMNLSDKQAHDALYDVILLEHLARRFLKYDELVNNSKSITSLVQTANKEKESKIYLQSLLPLRSVVSKLMLKKIAYAGISYEALITEYRKGDKCLIDLLQQNVETKTQVIKSKKIVDTILKYLKKIVI